MLSPKKVHELNQLFAEELELTKNDKTETWNKKWDCPIQAIQLGKYMIVPLTSRRMVKSEGYIMQNCVRDYIHLCNDGKYLLFSIRNRLNERAATLGVKKRDNRWYFDDCLGKENSVVIEEIIEFLNSENSSEYVTEYTEMFSVAHEVVRLLNC